MVAYLSLNKNPVFQGCLQGKFTGRGQVRPVNSDQPAEKGMDEWCRLIFRFPL